MKVLRTTIILGLVLVYGMMLWVIGIFIKE
jgi:hypothetical protein